MNNKEIKELISKMTLSEKASLCSGKTSVHTKEVERLGIGSVAMQNGPTGLRNRKTKNNYETYSLPATCFPTGVGMCTTWNEDLIEEVGVAIAEEALNQQVHIVLGPSINIKRSPLCGRNFEYMSEDPFLAGKIAKSFINGLQSKGIGAGVKHFAMNNQERRRMSTSANISLRALHEIYLTNFEIAVKESSPYTIMCSYNKINKEYCCEHKYLLNDVLREKWGYKGFVMTDWSAMNERVKALESGLELEMPFSSDENDNKIIAAVKNGTLDEKVLDTAVERLLTVTFKLLEDMPDNYDTDYELNHRLAQKAACESIVLLKNENHTLPLNKSEKTLFLGKFFEDIRYQGGGSSHVTPYKLEQITEVIGDKTSNYEYFPVYCLDSDTIDYNELDAAKTAAQTADKVVIFAGLPHVFESESYDREHMNLPAGHIELIDCIKKANPNTAVVLLNGAPVDTSWSAGINAIVEAYLGGQASASAICDILYGDVNPSGKLAETFPKKIEDTPCYLSYGKNTDEVTYSEDIFVGYRYYDTKKIDVAFPFGHGLSYTDFEYSDLKVSKDNEHVNVSFSVKNIGCAEGKEVAQLYVGKYSDKVMMPNKELRQFKKINLKPNEKSVLNLKLSARDFSHFDESILDWCHERGEYNIFIGSSSADIRLQSVVQLENYNIKKPLINKNTLVCDIMENEEQYKIVHDMLMTHAPEIIGHHEDAIGANSASSKEMLQNLFKFMPLRVCGLLSKGKISEKLLQEYIDKLNNIHGII